MTPELQTLTTHLQEALGIIDDSVHGSLIRDAIRFSYNRGYVDGDRTAKEEIFDAESISLITR